MRLPLRYWTNRGKSPRATRMAGWSRPAGSFHAAGQSRLGGGSLRVGAWAKVRALLSLVDDVWGGRSSRRARPSFEVSDSGGEIPPRILV